MKFISLFLIVFGPFATLSQSETSKWYFGQNAGLDFATTPPTALANGAMNTLEGCASMADGAGNLLFYTDAVNIWNQQHLVMANGTGLFGNGFTFTNQAALIVKQPGSTFDYFVFTLADLASPNGLRYSKVDMSLAIGMGSVTTKNLLIQTPSSEKMTAVKHCNGTDVWMISHDTDAVFRSFLISGSGVNSIPVISSFSNSGINYTYGGMKVSPDGSKIALSICYSNTVTNFGGFELYDFDNSTGAVSNKMVISPTLSNSCACSCEFSPDESKLYGTLIDNNFNSYLFQWNLCVNSSSAIASSQYTVSALQYTYTGSNSSGDRAAIQMASDGKLYVARGFKTNLGTINNPNAAGSACNYVDSGLQVSPGVTKAGLPNFVSSYFFTKTPQNFVYASTGNCSTSFSPQICVDLPQINNLLWKFGDPQSGTLNTSTITNASHHYSAPGTYTVQLIRNYKCYSDTVIQTVNVNYVTPTLSIAGSTSMCVGETRNFIVSGGNTYTWSNGSNLANLVVAASLPGTYNYSVTGTNTLGNCSDSKTLSVKVMACTSINEIETFYFKLFPNPTDHSLFIECENPVEIIIYNQLGEAIIQRVFDQGRQEIDLIGIESGIYYLDVKNTRGSTQHYKFVKEN